MMMLGFLANIANNFRNHYLQLVNNIQKYNQPTGFNYTNRPPSQSTPLAPVDTYEPTADTGQTKPEKTANTSHLPPATDTKQAKKTDTTPAAQPTDEYIPSKDKNTDSDSAPNDATYYFKRMAKLDYKLDMRFDLRAILSTARSIADGEVAQVDEFAAAGFGFQADFNIKGMEITQTNRVDSADSDTLSRNKSIVKFRNRQASQFTAQSRNFAVESFRQVATRMRSSHTVLNNGTYQQAINRFSARFRMDGNFSFANLQRFHVQTKRVAEEISDAAQKYVDTAGKVAQSGTTEMMATFFDAVDAYLDKAEDTLLEKVVGFFDQAAQELGFSGTMVDAAREQLTGTIERFFDRVDIAMSQIESQFVPEDMIQPTLPTDVPTVEPIPDVDPAVTQDTEQLAIA